MVAHVDSYGMESSSAMPSSEQMEHRYQRMRQLNNAASKRCRINHHRKFKIQEDNQILLTAKNMELKGKVADLESQVAKFKTAISNMMKKRTTKHVQACPEGASTASSATSNPQNDLSILSFNLLPKLPDDQLHEEIDIKDKDTIEDQIESSTEKDKSLFVAVSHPNLLAKPTPNNFIIESCKIKELFCEQCKLQFDKKIVYDIHLKIVHNKETTIKSELVDDKNDIPNVNAVIMETFPGLPAEPLPRLPTEPLPRLPTEPLPRLPSQPLPRLPSEPLHRLSSEPLTILPTEPLPRLPTEPLPRLPSKPLPRLPSEPLPRLPTEPLPRLLSEPLTRLPTEPLTMLPTEPLPRLPIEPIPIGIQNVNGVIIETFPRLPKEPVPIQTFQEISTEPIPYQKLDNFESPSIFETTESTLAQKSIMNMLPKSPVNQLHEEIHIKDEHTIENQIKSSQEIYTTTYRNC